MSADSIWEQRHKVETVQEEIHRRRNSYRKEMEPFEKAAEAVLLSINPDLEFEPPPSENQDSCLLKSNRYH